MKCYRRHYLTPQAEKIYRATGIRIYTQTPDEESCLPAQLAAFAETLAWTDYQKAAITSIYLESQPPLWTASGLLRRLLFPRQVSSYFHGEITLVPSSLPLDLCHELQHARLERLPQHQAFHQEWIACNRKPYKRYPALLRGMLVERTPNPDSADGQAQKDGFMSDYSRVSFDEDVSELVGTAIACPWQVIPLLTNDIIRQKINVAVRHQLLPQEWLDFAPVADAGFRRRWEDMIAVADTFLSAHPDSCYAAEALHLKATAYFRQEQMGRAAQICQTIVAMPNLKPSFYRRALLQLGRIAAETGNEATYLAFEEQAAGITSYYYAHPASLFERMNSSRGFATTPASPLLFTMRLTVDGFLSNPDVFPAWEAP